MARDPSIYIMMIGVAQFASGEGGTRYGNIMAAAVLATIPTLLANLFIRKQILSVLTEGTVEG